MEHVSLIYTLLLLYLAVNNANDVLDRLEFKDAKITNVKQLVDWSVLAPESFDHGIEGTVVHIRTTNFNFALRQGSYLEDFLLLTRLHDQAQGARGVQDWGDNDGIERVPPESLDEKAAYEMARGWLEKLGFDVSETEKKHKPLTRHNGLPFRAGEGVSSRFEVCWGEAKPPGSQGSSTPVLKVRLNQGRKWWVDFVASDLSRYRRPLPTVAHAVAVNLLPDEPVLRFLKLPSNEPTSRLLELGFACTNVFTLLDIPPDYEQEGRRLLVEETKSLLSILSCTEVDEPTPENLTDVYVNPPAFGSGGRLVFKNGEVRFDSNGRLSYFRFLPRGYTSHRRWMASAHSNLTTNDAYQIAIQKLKALSVDLEGLDSRCKPKFFQRPYVRYDESKKPVVFLTPEYQLVWGKNPIPGERPLASVSVYGDIGQVGRIELSDTSFWNRPPVVVPNREQRLARTNRPSRPTQADTPKAP